jgi:hypothetical protein
MSRIRELVNQYEADEFDQPIDSVIFAVAK